jgi:hypothetical protein
MPYFLRHLNLKENVAVDLNLYGNITKRLEMLVQASFTKANQVILKNFVSQHQSRLKNFGKNSVLT